MLAYAVFTNPIVDVAVVVVIVLLFFGPKRLPELGKGLGQGMREFKDSISGNSKDESEDRAALSSAPEPPARAAGSDTAGTAAGAPTEPHGRESAEVSSERQS